MNLSLRFLAPVCLVAVLLCPAAQAKPVAGDKTSSEIATDVGMVVLSGWGGASMVWGGVTLATAEPESWDAGFGRMNLIWGSVNLSIGLSTGVFSLIRAKRGWSEKDRLRYHAMKRTSLAVNLGLDFGYIAVGALLTRLGEVEGRDDLAGMGPALAHRPVFRGPSLSDRRRCDPSARTECGPCRDRQLQSRRCGHRRRCQRL